MTPELLLENTFFAFWYIFGTYFLAIWGFAFFVSLMIALLHLFRR